MKFLVKCNYHQLIKLIDVSGLQVKRNIFHPKSNKIGSNKYNTNEL